MVVAVGGLAALYAVVQQRRLARQQHACGGQGQGGHGERGSRGGQQHDGSQPGGGAQLPDSSSGSFNPLGSAAVRGTLWLHGGSRRVVVLDAGGEPFGGAVVVAGLGSPGSLGASGRQAGAGQPGAAAAVGEAGQQQQHVGAMQPGGGEGPPGQSDAVKVEVGA
jgi:hypothetical protein